MKNLCFFLFINSILSAFLLLGMNGENISQKLNEDEMDVFNTKKIQVVHIPKQNRLKIILPPTEKVSRFAVSIQDSRGNTMFVDNRYKFSGSYKREINVGYWKEGIYQVDIIVDKVKARKTVKIPPPVRIRT